MAGVANDGAALHFFEVLSADHAFVSRHGDVDVAFFHCFGHRHHAEAVHRGFDALDRVDFRNDHVRTKTLGAHSHATAAPTVPGNNYLLACKQHVRGSDDTVNRGLPGAVAIVKEVFRHRIVDGDDWVLQCSVLGHGAQTDYAGSGFFGPSNHVGDEIRALGQQHGDQIRAVVHGELRLVLQRRAQVRIVSVVILALDGESWNVVIAIQ